MRSRPLAFDNERYLAEQTRAILERVERFGQKLYLEFGGKLLHDYHASRVLPGYDPDVKMRLLHKLRDRAEIVLCIYAGDIERKKMRADFGITYDSDALRLIDQVRAWDLTVAAVVITRYNEQPSAVQFKNRLMHHGVQVYTHRVTAGYPTDVETIVSEHGYGANPFIPTEKPLVVVTGPGPGSGKLATCLSQLYHSYKRNVAAGYAKFETFPIWNLPLQHPVNVAYEAATADLHDVNMIDPFHLEAYGKTAVNYNRDIEAFPLLSRILGRIRGGEPFYRSPTEMGVNCAGFGIVDNDSCRAAAIQEVIRRNFRYRCEQVLGYTSAATVERAELLMRDLDAVPENRCVVLPAREAAKLARQCGKGHDGLYVGAALELPSGEVVTGKNSPMFHAASSLLLNALKKASGMAEDVLLLAPDVIASVTRLKSRLGRESASLDLEETLIALAVSATSQKAAQQAIDHLQVLAGCEMHITHIPTPGDEAGLRRLGINVTSDARFSGKNLFIA